MKNKVHFAFQFIMFFIFALISCEVNNIEEVSEVQPEISYWYNGAKLAVSFTWDDSNPNHYKVIAPIFDKYNLKASFFPICNTIKTAFYLEGYKQIASKGHEIGSHTFSHKDLTTLSMNQVETELLKSKQIIHDSLNVNALSFVHPFNKYNDSINAQVLKYYGFSRYASVVSRDNREIITLMSSFEKSKGVKYISNFKNQEKWLILAGHSADGSGYEPVNSNELDLYLSELKKEQEKEVWVGKFYEVALYDELRKLTSIDIVNENTLVINDSRIDKERYSNLKIENLILTLRLPMNIWEASTGDCIISKFQHENAYYINIDLFIGNVISF